MKPFGTSRAHAALAEQPVAALIGATLTGFGPDLVELRLNLRPDLRQQQGFAHCGVVSYLADNALVSRASVIHAGRQQAVLGCKVYWRSAGQEKLLAVAQPTRVSMDKLTPASSPTPGDQHPRFLDSDADSGAGARH